MDDWHWKMVDEDCRIMYPEDNLYLARLELEADVEYLVVEGAMYYYQMVGDDNWLRWALPKLEKGIDYMTSDPKRWDPEKGLVKRPFTIDTWDFTPEKRSGMDRRVHWFNRRLNREAKAKACTKLLVNGVETAFTVEKVGDSAYVNATIKENGVIRIEVLF